MAFFVFFFSLSIYLFTLTPSVFLHDSGDMTTASWVLGICHPTGYPFYMLCGKLFSSLIPIGSIAFRMNFLSSLFASLCVMVVYFITLNLTQNSKPSSIVSSLTLAFTTRFWEQAVIAEKYTLNGLFFALLTYLLITKRYLLFSFFLGLSFAHHTQTIFLIPGSLFFILLQLGKKRKKVKGQRSKVKIFLMIPLLFAIPLFLWLYLPIRALANPELNWNMPKDIFGFKNHITGFGYTGLFSLPTFLKVILHLKNRIFPLFLSQFAIIPLIFALMGFFLCFKRNPLFLVFALLTMLFNIYMAIGYNIPNIEDYYLPSFIYLSIFAGLCISFIPRRLFLICLLVPLIPLIAHFNFCNRRDYYLIYDHTLALLDSLKKDSVSLYTMDYNVFPLWYLLYVEERRKDISPILYPYFHQDWALSKLLQDKPYLNIDKSPSRNKPFSLLDAILKRRLETLILNNPNTPVYLDFKGYIPPGFIFIPSGFVFQIMPDNVDIERELDQNVPNFRIRKIKEIREGRSIGIGLEYSKAYKERGELYNILRKHNKALNEYLKAIKLDQKNPSLYKELAKTYAVLERYKEAEENYKLALKMSPNYAEAYAELGVVYFKLNKRKEAIESLKKALEINPDLLEAKRNLLIIAGEGI